MKTHSHSWKQTLPNEGTSFWAFFQILFSDFYFKQHNYNHQNRTEPQSRQTRILMPTYKFAVVQVIQKYHTSVRINFQITTQSMNGPEMSWNLCCALDPRKHSLSIWIIAVILSSHFLKHGRLGVFQTRRIVLFAAITPSGSVRRTTDK